jgi:hypothetical protein
MKTHIAVVAWLNIILGIPGLLAGLAILIVPAFLAMLGPLAAVFGVALGAFVLFLAGFQVFVGVALLQGRPWSRVAAIVLSILNLLSVHTLGVTTVFGIYSLWVLFHPDTERLFA